MKQSIMFTSPYLIDQGYYPLFVNRSDIDPLVSLLENAVEEYEKSGVIVRKSDGTAYHNEDAFSIEQLTNSAKKLQKAFRCREQEEEAIRAYLHALSDERDFIEVNNAYQQYMRSELESEDEMPGCMKEEEKGENCGRTEL